jgi:hypothetical protein
MGAFANEVPRKPSTIYVRGLTRYMKIQNPGRSFGVEMILSMKVSKTYEILSYPGSTYPQKAYIIIKRRVTMTPPTSSLCSPAITR